LPSYPKRAAGAYARMSRHGRASLTKAMRDAFEASWERKVDPMGLLPERERAQRIADAKKALTDRSASTRSGGGGDLFAGR
jgi:hypothetical protein